MLYRITRTTTVTTFVEAGTVVEARVQYENQRVVPEMESFVDRTEIKPDSSGVRHIIRRGGVEYDAQECPSIAKRSNVEKRTDFTR